MSTQTKPKPDAMLAFLQTVEVIPGFDCLAMKQEGQDSILAELKGKSHEEVEAYWAEARVQLKEMQAAALKRLG